jgi:hypothetical protein
MRMYVCNFFARRFTDMLPFDFMLTRRHVNAVHLYTRSVLLYCVLSKTGFEGDKKPKLLTHLLVRRHLCVHTESYISTANILT